MKGLFSRGFRGSRDDKGNPRWYMLTIEYVNVKVQKVEYEWVQKEEEKMSIVSRI
jgi:hypothetical protein